MTAHASSYSHPGASGRSIASLVLGILGIVICPLFAPFAWYLGQQDLGIEGLDPRRLEHLDKAVVLFAGQLAIEDVVEQQPLHQRRHHPVDLLSRAMDEDPS